MPPYDEQTQAFIDGEAQPGGAPSSLPWPCGHLQQSGPAPWEWSHS